MLGEKMAVRERIGAVGRIEPSAHILEASRLFQPVVSSERPPAFLFLPGRRASSESGSRSEISLPAVASKRERSRLCRYTS